MHENLIYNVIIFDPTPIRMGLKSGNSTYCPPFQSRFNLCALGSNNPRENMHLMFVEVDTMCCLKLTNR